MSRTALLKRAEWIVAILLTGMSIVLLVLRVAHAGGLWRDECAVVQLAEMSPFTDIFRNFQHEAFPPLFPLLVRAYMFLFGSSDVALRVFGFVVGCSVITAFWITARSLRSDVPLIALTLTALNTTFFVWGTTIRGYGVGSALVTLTFGYIGALLLNKDRHRAIAAVLVALFAAQVLLYNSILLLAIGGAAVAILLFQQELKRALVISGVCVVALIFLLPYLPSYLRAREWNILVRGWPTSYSLWKHFEVALGNPGYSVPALWYCIAIGSLGLFGFHLYRNHKARPNEHTRLIWFSILAGVFALIGCYAFLRILSYTTSNWYYLAFTCVCAAALDLTASIVCTHDWSRLVRLGIAGFALMAAPFADWTAVFERQTNVDLAAQAVSERVGTNDLILVAPWPFGIPFNRYYHGSARWMTIPNIGDHRVHRYDLIKAKMVSQQPIDDLRDAIRATLSSGNRVWFVGGLNLPRPEEGPMQLLPAPASRFKWDNRAYTAAWWQQLSVLIAVHADKVESVPLAQPKSVRVNELEQTSLAVAEGWH